MSKQKRKICIVTGSRAEYGLLHWLMKGIKKDSNLKLQVIATGMHLLKEFGMTYREIEKDGFFIDKKVRMLLPSDSPTAITKSTGLGIIRFADVLKKLKPDILVVLGDRFEILSATIAATFASSVICHIHGGETTEGAYDEYFRHSITKMAWWHFVATPSYKKRVIQLGEDPERVFVVGSPGIDNIVKSKLKNKQQIEKDLKINFNKKNLIITYHSVTLDKKSPKSDLKIFLKFLDKQKDTNFIFTGPNADTNGRVIKKMIKNFIKKNKKNSFYFPSMGRINYLSTLQYVDGVVGNSSSGLIEVPFFKIGTINIGDRQKGRIKAKSVIDCEPNTNSIKKAFDKLYSSKFKSKLKNISNPYGKGHATKRMLKILKNKTLPKNQKKVFYNL